MPSLSRIVTAAALATAAFAAPASLYNAKRQCSTSTAVSSTVIATTNDPVPATTSEAVSSTETPVVTTTAQPVTTTSASVSSTESSVSTTTAAEVTTTSVSVPSSTVLPTTTEVAAATTSSAPATTTTAVDSSLVCNGDSRLCDRKYSDIVWIGSHDSYAVQDASGTTVISDVASNQNIDIPSQLALGIRFLQAQTHLDGDTLSVCHTSCALYNGGSLSDYLKKVNDFLTADGNANEVVTLLITNGDNIDLSKWQDAFQTSGLESLVWTPATVPSTRDDWPTLRDLITANTRVVMIMDYNADTSKVPYILPEFGMMWENPFDQTNASPFNCSVDRSSGDATTQLGLINHYLDISLLGQTLPDQDAASTTNSADSITSDVANCQSSGSYKITHVLLDWVDQGQAIDAGRQLNDLD